MAEQQGGAFGKIKATAAADADHHIGPELLRLLDADADRVARHIRKNAVVH